MRFTSLTFALVSVMCWWSYAHALLPAKKNVELVLGFDFRSATLAAGEQKKLMRAIEEVKREDWCVLELAVVLAYAERGETSVEDSQELSKQRANNVASLLQQLGVSRHIIFFEGKGVEAASHRESTRADARAVVQLQGVPPHETCSKEAREKDGLRR